MNNELIVQKNNYMPSSEDFMQISSVSKTLATCPHYQKLGQGGVLTILLTAREMNLPPMLCLNGGMYTFSGAVTLSANLINLLIDQSGHRADVIELNERICTIEFVRGDRAEGQGKRYKHSFTIEDARIAGLLGKDNWKKHPKPMLYSRCLSAGAKIFIPSVMMGVYTHGEIEQIENNNSVPDISVIEVQGSKSPETNNEDAKIPVEPPIPIDPKIKEDFMIKHDLFEKEDKSISRKLQYVRYNATTFKKTEDYIIERACRNPEDFQNIFNEWQKKNFKNPVIEPDPEFEGMSVFE